MQEQEALNFKNEAVRRSFQNSVDVAPQTYHYHTAHKSPYLVERTSLLDASKIAPLGLGLMGGAGVNRTHKQQGTTPSHPISPTPERKLLVNSQLDRKELHVSHKPIRASRGRSYDARNLPLPLP